MPNVEEGYERFGVSEGYRMWEWVGENTGGMPTLEGGGEGEEHGSGVGEYVDEEGEVTACTGWGGGGG